MHKGVARSGPIVRQLKAVFFFVFRHLPLLFVFSWRLTRVSAHFATRWPRRERLPRGGAYSMRQVTLSKTVSSGFCRGLNYV